jgi:hypothetical protein
MYNVGKNVLSTWILDRRLVPSYVIFTSKQRPYGVFIPSLLLTTILLTLPSIGKIDRALIYWGLTEEIDRQKED